jgi:hypothetical protein
MGISAPGCSVRIKTFRLGSHAHPGKSISNKCIDFFVNSSEVGDILVRLCQRGN